jgi:hypothetical protein
MKMDGADPVEVGGHDAVLGAGGGHAHHLLRSEVGGQERKSGDPGRDAAAGLEEVGRGLGLLLEKEPDAQDEERVSEQDGVVDGREREAFHDGLTAYSNMRAGRE